MQGKHSSSLDNNNQTDHVKKKSRLNQLELYRQQRRKMFENQEQKEQKEQKEEE